MITKQATHTITSNKNAQRSEDDSMHEDTADIRRRVWGQAHRRQAGRRGRQQCVLQNASTVVSTAACLPLTATSTSRAPHLAKESPKLSQCDCHRENKRDRTRQQRERESERERETDTYPERARQIETDRGRERDKQINRHRRSETREMQTHRFKKGWVGFYPRDRKKW